MRDALLRLAVTIPREQIEVPQASLRPNSLTSALRIVFAGAGATAVIIIVLAAFKYVYSAGDSAQTALAKKAIIYALIGVVVCALAFSIVTFVINEATK